MKIAGLLILRKYANGTLVKEIHTPLNSYTRWYMRALCMEYGGYMYGPMVLAIRAEDGYYYGNNYIPADIFYTRPYKMACGSSNTPFSIDDYRLYNKKDEVTTLTQTEPPTATNGGAEMEYEGVVNITSEYDLWEVGMFSLLYTHDLSPRYYLASRDVLPSPIHVYAGDKVHIRYKIMVG